MLEVHPLVVILLSETAGVLFIVIVVWAFLVFQGKSKDKKAIKTLIANFNDDSETHKAELKSFLGRCGLTSKTQEERLASLLNAERTFLQTFITLYRKRDAQGVSELHGPLQELTAPYRAMFVGTPATSEKPGDDQDPSDAGQIDLPVGEEAAHARILELEEENARLTDELEVTRGTLDKMLNEYSSMFELRADGEGDAVLLDDDAPEDSGSQETVKGDTDTSSLGKDEANLDKAG